MTSTSAPRRGRPPSGGREAVLTAAVEVLRERGAAKLTTREVANRAGVSEGSVFYHFSDRTGLLTAVIEDGLRPLMELNISGITDLDVHNGLQRFAAAVEDFLDKALVVMAAAQSDVELRTALANFLLANNLGPHRGVQGLAQYLSVQQAMGTIRDDVDPAAVAFFVVSSCFMWVAQRQMIAEHYGADLPGREQLMDTLFKLLLPPST